MLFLVKTQQSLAKSADLAVTHQYRLIQELIEQGWRNRYLQHLKKSVAAPHSRHPELTCLLRLAKCVCTGTLRISPNHCRASSASCCDKSCTGCPRHRTLLALGSIQRGAQTSFALSREDCKLLLSEQSGDPHNPGETRGKNSNKGMKGNSRVSCPCFFF